MTALCDSLENVDADKLAPSLVHVFQLHNKCDLLIKTSIKKELRKITDEDVLFRTNSIAMKFASIFCRRIGLGYLKQTVLPLIQAPYSFYLRKLSHPRLAMKSTPPRSLLRSDERTI